MFKGVKMLLDHTLSTQDIDMKIYPRDLTHAIDLRKTVNIILSFNDIIATKIMPNIIRDFHNTLMSINAAASDIYIKLLPIAESLYNRLIRPDTRFEFSTAPLTDKAGKPVFKDGKMQFNPYKYKLIVRSPGKPIIVLSDIVIYNIDDPDKETLMLRKQDVEKLIKEDPEADIFKGKTAGMHPIRPDKLPGFPVNDPDNLLPELIVGNITGTKIYIPSLKYYYYNKKLLLDDLSVGKYKNKNSEYLRNKFSKQLSAIKTPSTKIYKGGRKQKKQTKRKKQTKKVKRKKQTKRKKQKRVRKQTKKQRQRQRQRQRILKR